MRARTLIRCCHLVVLLLGALGGWPLAVAAAPRCTLDATTIDFGRYDPLRATGIQAVGYVSYRCTAPVTNIRIALSAGNSGTAARRTLWGAGNGEPLHYLLTLDPTQTQIWGDGYGATTVYSQPAVPAHTLIRVPIYAGIPGTQIAAAGPFRDTITVQLSWN
jgi:spore coat protein U-like protein